MCDAIKIDENEIELSMGMSKDFEEAIRMGSTNVRVGSSIFGGRSYLNKEKGAAGDKEVAQVAKKLQNL